MGRGGRVRPIQSTPFQLRPMRALAQRGARDGARLRAGWICARHRGGAVPGCLLALVLLASTAEAGPTVDAIRGPWRWLEPSLGHVAGAAPETVGPWKDVAITRDGVRRSAEIDRIEAELVARDGGLIGAWDATGTRQAEILRRVREAPDNAELKDGLLLTINAVASGMRNTG